LSSTDAAHKLRSVHSFSRTRSGTAGRSSTVIDSAAGRVEESGRSILGVTLYPRRPPADAGNDPLSVRQPRPACSAGHWADRGRRPRARWSPRRRGDLLTSNWPLSNPARSTVIRTSAPTFRRLPLRVSFASRMRRVAPGPASLISNKAQIVIRRNRQQNTRARLPCSPRTAGWRSPLGALRAGSRRRGSVPIMPTRHRRFTWMLSRRQVEIDQTRCRIRSVIPCTNRQQHLGLALRMHP